MKRVSLFLFLASGFFLALFLFGVTDFGQDILRSRIPDNVTHQRLDDIYMGAGLAPWVYGLAPSVVLALADTALIAI